MSTETSGNGQDDVSEEDLIIIGSKVVEMADRIKVMHLACPGTHASWHFEVDGQRYRVRVDVAAPLETLAR